MFLGVIHFLLTTEVEDISVIKDLLLGLYNICLIAQENNDYLAMIIDVNFSLINLILKETMPKYQNHKMLLFYCIKSIGLLLTGYDTTVEVENLYVYYFLRHCPCNIKHMIKFMALKKRTI